MKRRAAFLDRDGTINVEVGFVSAPEQLALLPGAAAGIRALNDAGFAVVLVTNQSAIGRGMIDEARFGRIQDRLRELLAAEGAKLDAIYFCPHHPTEALPPYRQDCACRKPKPGLMLQAARDLDLELAGSHLVGDDLRDVQCTRGTPVEPWLVLTGKGRSVEAAARADLGAALHVVADLGEAARAIVAAR